MFERKTGDLFPLPVKIVGIVFGLGGLLAILQGSIMGIIFLALSVFALLAHSGFILDTETKRYKEYWGLLGLKIGGWKGLPAIKRITITNDTVVYRNQSHGTGLSTYSQNTKTALNLRINEREFILAAKGTPKDIMDDALYLSDKLNLEILDATKKDKKIINQKK